ncbi:MAG: hypothetical protein ACR2PX_12070 [Endozoicomonas sp.]|uniref:hypothetical protein n=1 Tax=Endozoicomonas sp. TaxID=1892382 RepID=UPI003D9B71FB
MSDLHQAISLETVDTLKKRYVTFCGVKPKQIRKAWLTDALTNGLSDRSLLKPYLQTLSELELAFVQEAVFNYNGLIEKTRFEAKYGQFPEKPRGSGFFYYGSELSEPVEPFFYPQDKYGALKIPDALRSSLKQLVDKPEPDVLQTAVLPDPLPDSHKVYERERLTLSELRSLLILLQDKQIKVSEKTGVASSATLRKVSKDTHEYYETSSCKEASGMESIVSYGWLRLLGNSKLSKHSKTTLIPAKKAGDCTADTIKEIWDQWVKNRTHDEFRRIDNIKGQTGKGKRFFTDVVARRQVVISALKECEVNAWVSFEDFSRLMFISGTELEITKEPEYLYIHSPGYGEFYSAPWDIMEGRYLRCFLVEYAATLGLIDVVMVPPDIDGTYYDDFGDMECLSRYDGLQFFRLTSLGAYVLGLADSYRSGETDTTETMLTIHRQGRIVFDENPTPWESRFLSLYADQDKQNVWKLSRRKIMEALQVGGSLDELKTFLLDREDQPFLPEDCESLLKQAEAHRDGVKIQGEYLIVTCKSQAIVDLVVNDKALSKWCQRLGKLQIVIPANKEKKFKGSINAMGIGCS